MKVLIIGSYGFFMNFLIRRLTKEGCRVYTVTGKRSGKQGAGLPRHVNYEFDAQDGNMSVIMRSVGAECIIFLGASDDRYRRAEFDSRLLCRFTGELTNILASVPGLETRKFLFLSDTQVYAPEGGSYLSEDAPLAADSNKRMALINGENLCRTFAGQGNYTLSILRLAKLYGPLGGKGEYCNELVEACLDALEGREIEADRNASGAYVYVSDAADAVYKAMLSEKEEEICLNVGGDNCGDVEAAALVAKCCGRTEGIKEVSGEFAHRQISSRAEETIGYRALVPLEEGIEKTARWVTRHRKVAEGAAAAKRGNKKSEERDAHRSLMERVRNGLLPFAENCILFAAAVAAFLLWGEKPFLADVDFLLLYIVLIATVHGAMQGYLSVVLSAGFLVWHMWRGGEPLGIVATSYEAVIRILFYVVLCITASYNRDHLLTVIRNQSDEMDDLAEELEQVIRINEANERLQKTYEQRILGSQNSIGRIHEIVSRFNILSPELFLKEVLEAVRELIGVREASIYMGGDRGFYRLSASSFTGRELVQSLDIASLPLMRDELIQDQVYLNRELREGYPSMAIPVFAGGRMIAFIVLWNVPYEKMNLDSAHTMAILGKIAASAFENANTYQQAVRREECWEDTSIYKPEVFARLYREHEELRLSGYSDHILLKVTGKGMNASELHMALAGCLRNTDLFCATAPDAEELTVLCTHTPESHFACIQEKLGRRQLQADKTEWRKEGV